MAARNARATNALRARALPALQGLQATSDDLAATRYTVQHLAVDDLHPRADQPRAEFDQATLDALAVDILERGVINPITVRPTAIGYEIIAGERRWRASVIAGRTNPSRLKIPCIVRDLSDTDATWMAIAENLQRDDLNAYEYATSVVQLYALKTGLPVDEVPARLNAAYNNPDDHAETTQPLMEVLQLIKGKDAGAAWASFVRNALPLLHYPEVLKAALRRGLAYTKASKLARLKDAAQLAEALSTVETQHLSVTETAKLVDGMLRMHPTTVVSKEAKKHARAVHRVVKLATPERLTQLAPAQLQEVQQLTERLQALLKP